MMAASLVGQIGEYIIMYLSTHDGGGAGITRCGCKLREIYRGGLAGSGASGL